jgi:hypothetical protein
MKFSRQGIHDWFSRRKFRQRLKKIAAEDYRSARGAAHLNLLNNASEALAAQIKALGAQRDSANGDIRRLGEEEQGRLERAVTDYIVYNHLNIPGIGIVKREQLLSIYKGRLSDFYKAQAQLSGFGPSTQAAIDRWIEKSKLLKQDLLRTSFPGGNEIRQTYAEKIKKIIERCDHIRIEINRKSAKKAHADEVIQWLRFVTVNDFLAALLEPNNPHEEVDAFLQGVFPAWGPVPDWFKDILDEAKH